MKRALRCKERSEKIAAPGGTYGGRSHEPPCDFRFARLRAWPPSRCPPPPRRTRPRSAARSGMPRAPNGELCTDCVGSPAGPGRRNSPLRLVSPANGVVTQWAVRTERSAARSTTCASCARSTTPPTRASGPARNAVVPPLTTDSVLINNVSLPIKQGDAIGVAAGPAGHDLPSWPDNVTGDVVGTSLGNFADGRLQAPSPTSQDTSCWSRRRSASATSRTSTSRRRSTPRPR